MTTGIRRLGSVFLLLALSCSASPERATIGSVCDAGTEAQVATTVFGNEGETQYVGFVIGNTQFPQGGIALVVSQRTAYVALEEQARIRPHTAYDGVIQVDSALVLRGQAGEARSFSFARSRAPAEVCLDREGDIRYWITARR
ncbi:MAG TPA: hypothetical protein VER55_01650 [Ardenticatenaceae bacterium]|nr:hypothetical protein [Ardenticatenaceae bacterium]